MSLISLQQYYCQFQVTFQRTVPKFVANLPITFPSLEIGRDLRNKVRKFISVFEFCFLLIICSSLYRAMHCTCLFLLFNYSVHFRSLKDDFVKIRNSTLRNCSGSSDGIVNIKIYYFGCIVQKNLNFDPWRYMCECVGVFGQHTMHYSIDT